MWLLVVVYIIWYYCLSFVCYGSLILRRFETWLLLGWFSFGYCSLRGAWMFDLWFACLFIVLFMRFVLVDWLTVGGC